MEAAPRAFRRRPRWSFPPTAWSCSRGADFRLKNRCFGFSILASSCELSLDGGDQLRVVGLGVGREAGHDFAVSIEEELLKVPQNLRRGVRLNAILAQVVGEGVVAGARCVGSCCNK